MPKNYEPEVATKELVLGDYVTVHVPRSMTNPNQNTEPSDIQVHREAFIQRIQKQRGEFLKNLRKRKGKLIDVRHSGAA